MRHPVTWLTASPSWKRAQEDGVDTTRLRRPAIVRFASDRFMEDLQAVLDTAPSGFTDLIAQRETQQDTKRGWLSATDEALDGPLKLYQPAHGYFYLVAASLVCQIPGLPDKTIDTAQDERASFVIRRLVPTAGREAVDPSDEASFVEYGWILGGEQPGWREVAPRHSVADAEERLPLFPMRFQEGNRKRRLLAGLIPVSSKETYQAGAALDPLDLSPQEAANEPFLDPAYRMIEFERSVAVPLQQLLQSANTPPTTAAAVADFEALLRGILLFIVLDFATFLHANIPAVLAETWSGPSGPPRDLFDLLNSAVFTATSISWAAALRDTFAKGEAIRAGAADAPAAGVSFITNNMSLQRIRNAITALGIQVGDLATLRNATVYRSVQAAMPTTTTPAPAAGSMEVPKYDPRLGAVYRLRCVYERPVCRGIRPEPAPGRGSVHPPLVSQPSRAFQLAAFFDPEAPARPVRITMPVDTSICGELWYAIDDLAAADPEVPVRDTSLPPGTSVPAARRNRSQAYTVDLESGEIRFGDGLRGARPPAGARIQASYQYGGGRQGLVDIGAITRGSTLPPGLKVTNPIPTWGGTEAESVEQTEQRVPRVLQHRHRLVTEEDYKEITQRAPGVDIGRVEVLALFHPDLPDVASEGVVTVMVIPRFDPVQRDAPRPNRLFLDAICRHLTPRRIITTELHVRGPVYRPVWVAVGLDVVPGSDIAQVRENVRRRLREFLSPLYGGIDGTGWPLGKAVERLELWAVATRVPGVSKVNEVFLGEQTGASIDRVPVTGLELPRIMAVSVQVGDPQTLEDLRGEPGAAPPAGPPTTVVPVPVIPEECR